MSRFNDEDYYDRHWDQNQFEGEDECDCYWLAGGDDGADVECGHCENRRLAEEKAEETQKDQICAIIRLYLDRHSQLTTKSAQADNFAQLFNYLIDKHEFLATQPVFREAVRNKAMEYQGHTDVAFICGRVLEALEGLRQRPDYEYSEREMEELYYDDENDYMSDDEWRA
jgi:hypothetical protein